MNSDEKTIQTLMYLINEVGTGAMTTLDSARESLLTSSKMLDVGSEVVIPAQAYQKSSEKYQYTRKYRKNNMEFLCMVLSTYLKHKKDEVFVRDYAHQRDYNKAFKYAEGSLLQFHDFYLCEQGLMYAERFLYGDDDFEYDDYGLAELAALFAIHMFRHLTIKEQGVWGLSDMKNHSGCLFEFEPGLNLVELFYDHVDNIEGIWRYEDDEDEDWE